MIDLDVLAHRIPIIAATPAGEKLPIDAADVIGKHLQALELGVVRAARRDADGEWHAVPWVKQGILLAFRIGEIASMSMNSGFSFIDKDTMPPQRFTVGDGVRIVPGGSAVRRGAYLARGVVCMPPMYVNVGAWVGEGTMIDSHALVGSCAQVGANCHISAAAQLGGVLEPINASPVIIEDRVIVGGNCGVYEGTVVREGAVLAAGVVLTRGTPVYDLVRETVYRGSAATPLVIPADAVVVPGTRRIRGGFAESEGLGLQTPVIVKYRDEKTDLATTLEAWLR
ncbi:MAG: 2,3,4,5-tetrahydropyridine-2,6-dicarboxylate N-succinyltransferase [Gemmatimonadaceae bacterium]|jgi:2,3,4,5-tetrahydropyridine-2-carboxylate N-succinyltransferase|nr:2,3,4,5-tetrahydropyridine-2,6-dicarboxylate N-succinyltransferase [Gemmatimonadaceae bacterium]MCU0626341.1 2,3,4,5-tetrahydropyridine-2,6-dicarboxylate N-succinyltransferase [Gemmatimonadaceae bacterium]